MVVLIIQFVQKILTQTLILVMTKYVGMFKKEFK